MAEPTNSGPTEKNVNAGVGGTNTPPPVATTPTGATVQHSGFDADAGTPTDTAQKIAERLEPVSGMRLRDPVTGKEYYAKAASHAEIAMTVKASALKLPPDSPLKIAQVLTADTKNIPPSIKDTFTLTAERPGFLLVEAAPNGVSMNQINGSGGSAPDKAWQAKPISAVEYKAFLESVLEMNKQGVTHYDIPSNTNISRDADGKLRIYLYDFEPHTFREYSELHAGLHADYEGMRREGANLIKKGTLQQDAAGMLNDAYEAGKLPPEVAARQREAMAPKPIRAGTDVPIERGTKIILNNGVELLFRIVKGNDTRPSTLIVAHQEPYESGGTISVEKSYDLPDIAEKPLALNFKNYTNPEAPVDTIKIKLVDGKPFIDAEAYARSATPAGRPARSDTGLPKTQASPAPGAHAPPPGSMATQAPGSGASSTPPAPAGVIEIPDQNNPGKIIGAATPNNPGPLPETVAARAPGAPPPLPKTANAPAPGTSVPPGTTIPPVETIDWSAPAPVAPPGDTTPLPKTGTPPTAEQMAKLYEALKNTKNGDVTHNDRGAARTSLDSNTLRTIALMQDAFPDWLTRPLEPGNPNSSIDAMYKDIRAVSAAAPDINQVEVPLDDARAVQMRARTTVERQVELVKAYELEQRAERLRVATPAREAPSSPLSLSKPRPEIASAVKTNPSEGGAEGGDRAANEPPKGTFVEFDTVAYLEKSGQSIRVGDVIITITPHENKTFTLEVRDPKKNGGAPETYTGRGELTLDSSIVPSLDVGSTVDLGFSAKGFKVEPTSPGVNVEVLPVDYTPPKTSAGVQSPDAFQVEGLSELLRERANIALDRVAAPDNDPANARKQLTAHDDTFIVKGNVAQDNGKTRVSAQRVDASSLHATDRVKLWVIGGINQNGENIQNVEAAMAKEAKRIGGLDVLQKQNIDVVAVAFEQHITDSARFKAAHEPDSTGRSPFTDKLAGELLRDVKVYSELSSPAERKSSVEHVQRRLGTNVFTCYSMGGVTADSLQHSIENTLLEKGFPKDVIAKELMPQLKVVAASDQSVLRSADTPPPKGSVVQIINYGDAVIKEAPFKVNEEAAKTFGEKRGTVVSPYGEGNRVVVATTLPSHYTDASIKNSEGLSKQGVDLEGHDHDLHTKPVEAKPEHAGKMSPSVVGEVFNNVLRGQVNHALAVASTPAGVTIPPAPDTLSLVQEPQPLPENREAPENDSEVKRLKAKQYGEVIKSVSVSNPDGTLKPIIDGTLAQQTPLAKSAGNTISEVQWQRRDNHYQVDISSLTPEKSALLIAALREQGVPLTVKDGIITVQERNAPAAIASPRPTTPETSRSPSPEVSRPQPAPEQLGKHERAYTVDTKDLLDLANIKNEKPVIIEPGKPATPVEPTKKAGVTRGQVANESGGAVLQIKSIADLTANYDQMTEMQRAEALAGIIGGTLDVAGRAGTASAEALSTGLKLAREFRDAGQATAAIKAAEGAGRTARFVHATSSGAHKIGAVTVPPLMFLGAAHDFTSAFNKDNTTFQTVRDLTHGSAVLTVGAGSLLGRAVPGVGTSLLAFDLLDMGIGGIVDAGYYFTGSKNVGRHQRVFSDSLAYIVAGADKEAEKMVGNENQRTGYKTDTAIPWLPPRPEDYFAVSDVIEDIRRQYKDDPKKLKAFNERIKDMGPSGLAKELKKSEYRGVSEHKDIDRRVAASQELTGDPQGIRSAIARSDFYSKLNKKDPDLTKALVDMAPLIRKQHTEKANFTAEDAAEINRIVAQRMESQVKEMLEAHRNGKPVEDILLRNAALKQELTQFGMPEYITGKLLISSREDLERDVHLMDAQKLGVDPKLTVDGKLPSLSPSGQVVEISGKIINMRVAFGIDPPTVEIRLAQAALRDGRMRYAQQENGQNLTITLASGQAREAVTMQALLVEQYGFKAGVDFTRTQNGFTFTETAFNKIVKNTEFTAMLKAGKRIDSVAGVPSIPFLAKNPGYNDYFSGMRRMETMDTVDTIRGKLHALTERGEQAKFYKELDNFTFQMLRSGENSELMKQAAAMGKHPTWVSQETWKPTFKQWASLLDTSSTEEFKANLALLNRARAVMPPELSKILSEEINKRQDKDNVKQVDDPVKAGEKTYQFDDSRKLTAVANNVLVGKKLSIASLTPHDNNLHHIELRPTDPLNSPERYIVVAKYKPELGTFVLHHVQYRPDGVSGGNVMLGEIMRFSLNDEKSVAELGELIRSDTLQKKMREASPPPIANKKDEKEKPAAGPASVTAAIPQENEKMPEPKKAMSVMELALKQLGIKVTPTGKYAVSSTDYSAKAPTAAQGKIVFSRDTPEASI